MKLVIGNTEIKNKLVVFIAKILGGLLCAIALVLFIMLMPIFYIEEKLRIFYNHIRRK
jgi:hypothetical protein